jgi:GntR family transcriptional regulator
VQPAGQDEASILGTAPGAPLLAIRRTTRDSDGVLFEYSHDLFRADRTVITVRTPAVPANHREPGRVVRLRPRLKG